MNLFYRLMVNGMAATLDDKINEAINKLENYHKFTIPENSIFDNDNALQFSENRYIKRQKDDKVIYDIFFDNLHIHISESDTEKIYSIRLKKSEDSWEITRNGSANDYSHLNNKTYEVYVWYEVPVLDITKSIGYNYKNGNWDGYFYRTVHKFLNSVHEITDESQFNEAYK